MTQAPDLERLLTLSGKGAASAERIRSAQRILGSLRSRGIASIGYRLGPAFGRFHNPKLKAQGSRLKLAKDA